MSCSSGRQSDEEVLSDCPDNGSQIHDGVLTNSPNQGGAESALQGSVSFSVVEGNSRRRFLEQGASFNSLDENVDNDDENTEDGYCQKASNESLDQEPDVSASCESLNDDDDQERRKQRAKFRIGSMTDDMYL